MRSAFQVAATVLLLWAEIGSAAVVPKSSRFKFYTMPGSFSGPCDLAEGVDKAIWVQDILDNQIVRIDPTTGKLKNIKIPYSKQPSNTSAIPQIAGRTPLACAIQPGGDGNMYAATGVRNQFVQINPKTYKVKVFDSPGGLLGNLQPFNDLFTTKEGMYYTHTSANLISFFDYKKEKFTKSWKIPTPASFPLGIKVASDGSVWFMEFVGQKVGRLNATTGEFKEYPVPLPGLAAPAVVRAEKNGKLYFTAAVGNAIGAVDIKTGKLTRFGAKEVQLPGTDILDGKGNVWFSSFSSDTLGRVNPDTGRVSAIQTPTFPKKHPIIPILAISVTYGSVKNAIYWTSTASNVVGRLLLK